MLAKLEANKWVIETARMIIIAAFVFGIIWATLLGRVSALEKTLLDNDSPTRIEFDYLVKEVGKNTTLEGQIENKLLKVPSMHQMNSIQSTLARIEQQLNDTAPRVIELEKNVAVISATYKSINDDD